MHGLFQGRGDPHVIDHQPALFVAENAVHPRDGLHQVVPGHGLVHIQRGQGRHVKAGQPHIHHDGDLQGGFVVLEASGQRVPVGLVADYLAPFLRVVVFLGHDHRDFLCPGGAQFQDSTVDLHGDGAGVRHDHRLARQQIRPVVFVMAQNVADQRVDGLVRAQDGLHLAQFLFAFLDGVGIRVLGHRIVFLVDQAQGFPVQLQVDDAALIVDRAGRAVLHRLGHVVNVDVIAEHLPRAPVFGGDRGAREPDVGRVGQAVADDAGGADGGADLQLALVVLARDDFLGQAVLPPMGLIRQNHDVATLGQGLAGLLKLLHRGKDNAVCLPVGQQRSQMLSALGLPGRLAQKVTAPGELPVQLVVQIVAVGEYHERGTLQRLLQRVGIKDHRQGFAAALRVPEHAALAVGRGGAPGGFDGLPHREILVIRRQHLEGVLPVHVEADEVSQDVQETGLPEQPLKEGVKLCVLRVPVIAVLRLPRHEAVFAGSDGARLGGGQVAHHANLIVDEERRDLMHVVAELPIGCRGVGLLPGRRLQLHHRQRQTVDEEDNVRALLRVLHDCPLIGDGEIIVGRVAEIDQPDQRRTLLSPLNVLDGHAGLQIIREGHVLLEQRARFEVLDLMDGLVQRLQGKPRVDASQRGEQQILIERVMMVPPDLRPVDMDVPQHLGEQLNYCFLVVGLCVRHNISRYGVDFIKLP